MLRTGPNAKQFPQPTIFDSLQESGHDWMMIYNDSKHETYVESLTTPNAAEHTYNMDEFFHRAEHGTLPALTWIGPREGTNASLGDLGSERLLSLSPCTSDPDGCCGVRSQLGPPVLLRRCPRRAPAQGHL